MKKLSFYDTQFVNELDWPVDGQDITLNDSALEVFTDFNKYKPLVIDASTSAVDAHRLMQQTHVRLKFVVDQNNHFIGVVSLDDLSNQELIKKLSDGFNRDELTVADFMRTKSQLRAFDYDELVQAKISDLIEALKGSGQQHCLVVDRIRYRIRGIFSASDLARKLRLPVDIENKSSFVHVFNAISRQHAS